jgi:hypothetical protein
MPQSEIIIERIASLERKIDKVMMILNVLESEVHNPKYPPTDQVGALNEAY